MGVCVWLTHNERPSHSSRLGGVRVEWISNREPRSRLSDSDFYASPNHQTHDNLTPIADRIIVPASASWLAVRPFIPLPFLDSTVQHQPRILRSVPADNKIAPSWKEKSSRRWTTFSLHRPSSKTSDNWSWWVVAQQNLVKPLLVLQRATMVWWCDGDDFYDRAALFVTGPWAVFFYWRKVCNLIRCGIIRFYSVSDSGRVPVNLMEWFNHGTAFLERKAGIGSRISEILSHLTLEWAGYSVIKRDMFAVGCFCYFKYGEVFVGHSNTV